MKITKKTWLPIFAGFYETYYINDDCLLDSELSHFDVSFTDLIEPIKDFLSDKFYNNIDYVNFKIDFLRFYCSQLSTDNIKFTYESISSPNYYNYSNDSCNVIVEIKDWNIIKKFIYDNLNKFDEYIKKRYTSYSGFYSGFPNDINYWLNIVNKPEKDTFKHEIGSILEFYYLLDYKLNKNDFNFESLDYVIFSEIEVYIENYIDYNKLLELFNEQFNINYLTFNDVLTCNSLSNESIEKYYFNLSLKENNLVLC